MAVDDDSIGDEETVRDQEEGQKKLRKAEDSFTVFCWQQKIGCH